MKCRAVADGDDCFLSGHKAWITNAGFSDYYTVLAVTDPAGKRGSNVSAFVVEKSDAGFSFGAPERKLGIKGSPTRELIFENVRIPGDRMVGAPGEGLKIALGTLDHTRVTIGAQAVASPRERSTSHWNTCPLDRSPTTRGRSFVRDWPWLSAPVVKLARASSTTRCSSATQTGATQAHSGTACSASKSC
jgi:hypothetical protein